MDMLQRATFRLAAMLGPWLCAWSMGCQGLPGREPADTGASFAQAAGPGSTEASGGLRRTSFETLGADSPANAALGTLAQTAPRAPAESPGRAAMLGNPRIGPNSEIAWSIKDLPNAAPGSLVGGRGTVSREGRLNLGGYGSILVAGLTQAEATSAIEEHVQRVIAQGGRPMDDPPISTAVVTRAPPPDAPRPAPVPPVREPVTNVKAAPPAPPKADGAPAPSKPRAEPPTAVPFAKPREMIAAKPTSDSPLRPVAYQAPAVPAPAPAPAGAPPAADTPLPAPAGDSLPTPRVVPGQEHLTPVPADPGMEPGGAGDGVPVPRELAMASLPPYVLDPPDVLVVESTQGLRDQPIRGQHLIRPDGTISLGIYGSVHVAGMTIDHARLAIGQVLAQRIKDFDLRNLSVDVLSYNSKVYYVITDGGGYGEQVYRVPVTGSETVLDAISQINGLPPVASKRKIWVARRTAGDDGPIQVYPVDWRAITQQGLSTTNYQVLPGDRIYVKADCLMRIDNALAKFLSPVQRILGTTLLGGATVSTVGGRGVGSGLGNSFIAR